MWGAFDPQSPIYNANAANNILTDVFAMLGDPDFWARYSQYGVGPMAGGTWIGSNPSLGTGAPGDPGVELTDQTIQQLIVADIGKLSSRPPGQLIDLVMLPAGIGYTNLDTNCSGGSNLLCFRNPGTGRHDHFSNNGSNIVYAVVEYDPSSNGSFTNTDTPAHEVMEAASDPLGNGYFSAIPSNVPAAGHPGNSTLEIGDLCNARGELVDGLWWQQSWLQDQCRCDGDGTVRAFWGTDNGFTGAPIGDWANWNYKGQCSPGQPVAGWS